jgi:hypothetical protein
MTISELLGAIELAQLLLAVIAINAWNRVAISTHMVPDL